MQIFSLIPLVLESYAIYTVITYFMRDLINSNSFPPSSLEPIVILLLPPPPQHFLGIDNLDLFELLTGRYYAQYIDLREFYFKANNIQSITRVIPVPMLSSVCTTTASRQQPIFKKKQFIKNKQIGRTSVC